MRSRELSFPAFGSLGTENWKTGDSSLITYNLELSDASRAKTETGKLKSGPSAIPPFFGFCPKTTDHIGLD
jgi:hypothetical protein